MFEADVLSAEFRPLAVSRFYITDSSAQSGRPFGATVLGEQNGSERIVLLILQNQR